MTNQVIKGIIALVAAGAAAGLLAYHFSSGGIETGEEPSRVTYFVCSQPECRHEWNMTLGEVSAASSAGGVVCPECGDQMVLRGGKCPHCGGIYATTGHGLVPLNCPDCGAQLRNRTFGDPPTRSGG